MLLKTAGRPRKGSSFEERLTFESKRHSHIRQLRLSAEDESLADLKSPWKDIKSKASIHKTYEIGELIGEGYSGTVRRATSRSTQEAFALKTIIKEQVKFAAIKNVFSEIEIFKELDSPFIATFHECYEEQKVMHIVMELCEGGDLSRLVRQGKKVELGLARKLFWQAAMAVMYLHNVGVVHRDIKLENFLLTKADPEQADLKVVDFGFATYYKNQSLTQRPGTALFVAPEVLLGCHSKECDVWSLGVMLFYLLAGKPPFKGRDDDDTFDQILNKEVNFEPLRHAVSSPKEVVSLLSGMLAKDPAKRLTMSQVLANNWCTPVIVEYNARWRPFISEEVLQSIRDLPARTSFQREMLKLLVKMNMKNEHLQTASRIFVVIDFLNNGLITKHELRQVFKDFEIPVSQEECDRIIERMFLRAEEVITYSEFIAATINKRFFEEDKFLRPVFDRIDVDGGGVITFDNIRDCFQRFGYALDKQTIDGFIQEFDSSKDGTITFEEFKAIMERS